MVIRKKPFRRRLDRRRESLCRKCVGLVIAVAMILPPFIWDQITSIAGIIHKLPVSTGEVSQHAALPKIQGGL